MGRRFRDRERPASGVGAGFVVDEQVRSEGGKLCLYSLRNARDGPGQKWAELCMDWVVGSC